VSWSALLGETGRIPVSNANELEERNPAGGTDKAERRRAPGAARRLRRQAQRCPVKVGGRGSNDDNDKCAGGHSQARSNRGAQRGPGL